MTYKDAFGRVWSVDLDAKTGYFYIFCAGDSPTRFANRFHSRHAAQEFLDNFANDSGMSAE